MRLYATTCVILATKPLYTMNSRYRMFRDACGPQSSMMTLWNWLSNLYAVPIPGTPAPYVPAAIAAETAALSFMSAGSNMRRCLFASVPGFPARFAR